MAVVREHGDKQTMPADAYAKWYHPGNWASDLPALGGDWETQFIATGLFEDHPRLRKLREQNRDEVLKGAQQLHDQGYVTKVRHLTIMPVEDRPGTWGIYYPSSGWMGINPDSYDDVADLAFHAERFGVKASQYVVGGDYTDIFRHEYAHVIWNELHQQPRQKIMGLINGWFDRVGKDGVIGGLSAYAYYGGDFEELWAEAFCRLTAPDYKPDELPFDMRLLDILRKEGILSSPVEEHGDKGDPNYERDFHPGWGAEYAQMYQGWPEDRKERVLRTLSTGLFREGTIFTGLSDAEHDRVLEEAQRLHEMGFVSVVPRTETRNLSSPRRLGEYSPEQGVMRLRPNGDYSKGHSTARDVGDAFRHEYAHVMFDRLSPESRRPITDMIAKWAGEQPDLVGAVSMYFAYFYIAKPEHSHSLTEQFAEVFSIITRADYQQGYFPFADELMRLTLNDPTLRSEAESDRLFSDLFVKRYNKARLQEHGDKNDPNYERDFHPGDGESGRVEQVDGMRAAEQASARVSEMVAAGRATVDTGVNYTKRALDRRRYGSEVWVAWHGDDVAGAISAERVGGPDMFENYVNIGWLGTTGIADGTGSALVREVIRWAVEEGVMLRIEAAPEAFGFWEKMGFRYDVPGSHQMHLPAESARVALGEHGDKNDPNYARDFHPGSGRLTEEGSRFGKIDKRRLGRCYELAGRHFMDYALGGQGEGMALVHGSISGFGYPRIGHSWVVLPGGKVWEPTTGREWDGTDFSVTFNPRVDQQYAWEEAAKQMLRTSHWGPWGPSSGATKLAEHGDPDTDADYYTKFHPEAKSARAIAARAKQASAAAASGTILPAEPFAELDEKWRSEVEREAERLHEMGFRRAVAETHTMIPGTKVDHPSGLIAYEGRKVPSPLWAEIAPDDLPLGATLTDPSNEIWLSGVWAGNGYSAATEISDTFRHEYMHVLWAYAHPDVRQHLSDLVTGWAGLVPEDQEDAGLFDMEMVEEQMSRYAADSIMDGNYNEAVAEAFAIMTRKDYAPGTYHFDKEFMDVILDLGSFEGISAVYAEHGDKSSPDYYTKYHPERAPGAGAHTGAPGIRVKIVPFSQLASRGAIASYNVVTDEIEMSQESLTSIDEHGAGNLYWLGWDKDGNRLETSGHKEFPEGWVNGYGGSSHDFAHEVGHAWEHQTGLESNFDAFAGLGKYDPDYVGLYGTGAFVFKGPDLGKGFKDATAKNPSEAMADVFADYVQIADKMDPTTRAWIEGYLDDNWRATIEQLRAHPDPRDWVAQHREHGDPDTDEDYYTKYHPRQQGAISAFSGLKGAQVNRAALAKGEETEVGDVLIHAIRDAPATAPKLWRGVGMKKGQAARKYKSGSQVWLNLSSWSATQGTAEHFARQGKWSGLLPVVFILDEGAKAVKAGEAAFFEEDEWMTAGLFEIGYVSKPYGRDADTRIYMTQIDTFEDAAQVATVKLTEHGDPTAMTKAEYEAFYHPGTYRTEHVGSPITQLLDTGLVGKVVFARANPDGSIDKFLPGSKEATENLVVRRQTEMVASTAERGAGTLQELGFTHEVPYVVPVQYTHSVSGHAAGVYYHADGGIGIDPYLETWQQFAGYTISRSDGDIFRHEYGHALYFAEPHFRERVNEMLDKWLVEMPNVFNPTTDLWLRRDAGLVRPPEYLLHVISKYASEGDKEHGNTGDKRHTELWAEAFAMMTHRGYGGHLPFASEAVELMKEYGFLKADAYNFAEHGDPESMSAEEYAEYHPGKEHRQIASHLLALLKARTQQDDRGRLPSPETGPRTGYPEPYDPNRPHSGDLISHDDYLYWTAATEPRLEAIRKSTIVPGSLGDRLHGAIEAAEPTTEQLVRGARYTDAPSFFEGQRLFLPLISFSGYDIAKNYVSPSALERAGKTLHPALIYLEPGAKAFHISAVTGVGPFADPEWVTMGVFTVVSVGSQDGMPSVTIRQVGVQPRRGAGMAEYREHGDKADPDYATRFHPGGREQEPLSAGPFYHGTNVALTPGRHGLHGYGGQRSRADLTHDQSVVYMSTEPHLAERYAVARAGRLGGEPHVYEVKPTTGLAHDPEYLMSGWGSDQYIADAADIVAEIPLPGLVYWENGRMMRVLKEHGDPNTMTPAEYAKYHPNSKWARPAGQPEAVGPAIERVQRAKGDTSWLAPHDAFDATALMTPRGEPNTGTLIPSSYRLYDDVMPATVVIYRGPDGKPVGTLKHYETWAGGFILDVEVRGSERGKGYGTAMYDWVQDNTEINLYDAVGRYNEMTAAGKAFALRWLEHRLVIERERAGIREASGADPVAEVLEALERVRGITVREHGDPDKDPNYAAEFHPGPEGDKPKSDAYADWQAEIEAKKQAIADGINARVAEFRAQGGVIEIEPEGGIGSDGIIDMMAADMPSGWEQSRGVQFTKQAIERGRKTRREKPELDSAVITAWTTDSSGYGLNVAGALNYFVMNEFRVPFGKTYKRKYVYGDYVGSTGILKGVGSALARELVLEAAKRKLPLLITADPPALSYWQDVWGMQRNPFNFDLGNTWSRMSGSGSIYGLTAAQVKDLAKRLKADGSLINAHLVEIAAEIEQYDPDAAPFRDAWLALFKEHGDPDAMSTTEYRSRFHPGTAGLPRRTFGDMRPSPGSRRPMSDQEAGPTGPGLGSHPAQRLIDRVQGKPEALVTVYRGEEKGTTRFMPGDWVTPSDSYARLYAPGGNVLSMRVPAGELYGTRWGPQEWTWWPPGYFEKPIAEHGDPERDYVDGYNYRRDFHPGWGKRGEAGYLSDDEQKIVLEQRDRVLAMGFEVPFYFDDMKNFTNNKEQLGRFMAGDDEYTPLYDERPHWRPGLLLLMGGITHKTWWGYGDDIGDTFRHEYAHALLDRMTPEGRYAVEDMVYVLDTDWVTANVSAYASSFNGPEERTAEVFAVITDETYVPGTFDFDQKFLDAIRDGVRQGIETPQPEAEWPFIEHGDKKDPDYYTKFHPGPKGTPGEKAVRSWTGYVDPRYADYGTWVTDESGAIRAALRGQGTHEQAEALLRLTAEAPHYDGRLFRGIAVSDESFARLAALRKGETYDMNLSAWTTDFGAAMEYSNPDRGERKTGRNRVIFALLQGAHALSVEGMTPLAWEKEYLTQGRFRVLKNESIPFANPNPYNVMVQSIWLEQIEPFTAPEQMVNVIEHGDKELMTPEEYAQYHPGVGGSLMAEPAPGDDFDTAVAKAQGRIDETTKRLKATGLFVEDVPFAGLPEVKRKEVAREAQRLADMGWRTQVTKTGLLPPAYGGGTLGKVWSTQEMRLSPRMMFNSYNAARNAGDIFRHEYGHIIEQSLKDAYQPPDSLNNRLRGVIHNWLSSFGEYPGGIPEKGLETITQTLSKYVTATLTKEDGGEYDGVTEGLAEAFAIFTRPDYDGSLPFDAQFGVLLDEAKAHPRKLDGDEAEAYYKAHPTPYTQKLDKALRDAGLKEHGDKSDPNYERDFHPGWGTMAAHRYRSWPKDEAEYPLRFRATGLFNGVPFSTLPTDEWVAVLEEAEHLHERGFSAVVEHTESGVTGYPSDVNGYYDRLTARMGLRPHADHSGGYSASRTIADDFRHEYGHVIWHSPGMDRRAAMAEINLWAVLGHGTDSQGRAPDHAKAISAYFAYAFSHPSWHASDAEQFAELFSVIYRPDYLGHLYPLDQKIDQILQQGGFLPAPVTEHGDKRDPDYYTKFHPGYRAPTDHRPTPANARALSDQPPLDTLEPWQRHPIMDEYRGKPEALVTVYRGVRSYEGARRAKWGEQVRPGDWVSIDESFARHYGGRVLTAQLPAGELYGGRPTTPYGLAGAIGWLPQEWAWWPRDYFREHGDKNRPDYWRYHPSTGVTNHGQTHAEYLAMWKPWVEAADVANWHKTKPWEQFTEERLKAGEWPWATYVETPYGASAAPGGEIMATMTDLKWREGQGMRRMVIFPGFFKESNDRLRASLLYHEASHVVESLFNERADASALREAMKALDPYFDRGESPAYDYGGLLSISDWAWFDSLYDDSFQTKATYYRALMEEAARVGMPTGRIKTVKASGPMNNRTYTDIYHEQQDIPGLTPGVDIEYGAIRVAEHGDPNSMSDAEYRAKFHPGPGALDKNEFVATFYGFGGNAYGLRRGGAEREADMRRWVEAGEGLSIWEQYAVAGQDDMALNAMQSAWAQAPDSFEANLMKSAVVAAGLGAGSQGYGPEASETSIRLVRAMYERTQERLADGPATYRLYRGLMPGEDDRLRIRKGTLESWSGDLAVALRFARFGGRVYTAEVPREAIFMVLTGGHGFGLREDEMVVIGAKRGPARMREHGDPSMPEYERLYHPGWGVAPEGATKSQMANPTWTKDMQQWWSSGIIAEGEPFKNLTDEERAMVQAEAMRLHEMGFTEVVQRTGYEPEPGVNGYYTPAMREMGLRSGAPHDDHFSVSRTTGDDFRHEYGHVLWGALGWARGNEAITRAQQGLTLTDEDFGLLRTGADRAIGLQKEATAAIRGWGETVGRMTRVARLSPYFEQGYQNEVPQGDQEAFAEVFSLMTRPDYVAGTLPFDDAIWRVLVEGGVMTSQQMPFIMEHGDPDIDPDYYTKFHPEAKSPRAIASRLEQEQAAADKGGIVQRAEGDSGLDEFTPEERSAIEENAARMQQFGFTKPVYVGSMKDGPGHLLGQTWPTYNLAKSGPPYIGLTLGIEHHSGYSLGSNIGDTFRHEYLHALLAAGSTTQGAEAWMLMYRTANPSLLAANAHDAASGWLTSHLSQYAADEQGEEAVAEAFGLITRPDYVWGTLPFDEELLGVLGGHRPEEVREHGDPNSMPRDEYEAKFHPGPAGQMTDAERGQVLGYVNSSTDDAVRRLIPDDPAYFSPREGYGLYRGADYRMNQLETLPDIADDDEGSYELAMKRGHEVEAIEYVQWDWQDAVTSPASALVQSSVSAEFGVHGMIWSAGQPLLEVSDYSKQAVRATYDETQRILAKRGIEMLTVYRGIGSETGVRNVLESWTTDRTIAEMFAVQRRPPNVSGGVYRQIGYVLSATVPASAIFLAPVYDGENLREREVVIIGDRIPALTAEEVSADITVR